jgi:multimeric flavodoxin WrbA
MKLIAINGSPRKDWNTATLLEHCIKGAESRGAEARLIHLYDLEYKGCRSCFACKMANGKSYGRCACQDGLSAVLQTVHIDADILVLGSPIYFGGVTGEMKSFLERLLFASHVYALPEKTLFPRKVRTGAIITMNVTEQMFAHTNYGSMIMAMEATLLRTFGHVETYCCYDTYQFADYSKVQMQLFDPNLKAERKEKVFPLDCKNAFDLGFRLAAN